MQDKTEHILQVSKLPIFSNFTGILFTDSQIEGFRVSFGFYDYTVVVEHEEYPVPPILFQQSTGWI
jgi:hypothetical protein